MCLRPHSVHSAMTHSDTRDQRKCSQRTPLLLLWPRQRLPRLPAAFVPARTFCGPLASRPAASEHAVCPCPLNCGSQNCHLGFGSGQGRYGVSCALWAQQEGADASSGRPAGGDSVGGGHGGAQKERSRRACSGELKLLPRNSGRNPEEAACCAGSHPWGQCSPGEFSMPTGPCGHLGQPR